MATCCGVKCRTPYCPQCGKAQGDPVVGEVIHYLQGKKGILEGIHAREKGRKGAIARNKRELRVKMLARLGAWIEKLQEVNFANSKG